jgi:hypothetical protein
MLITRESSNHPIRFGGAILSTMIIGSLGLSGPALGAESGRSQAETRAIIEEALSAAPPQVARTATVIDLAGEVVREGSGNYTCLPGPPGFAGPMCHDEQFMKWMQAAMSGEEAPPVTEIGTSYMLAGDSPDGGASNIDPAARTPTAENQWVVEGPHVMLIVPDSTLLQGLPTTPDTDGPYVMWPDSPYAHVMWPVDERPQQREFADE